jgi:hypothetical protein
MRVSERMSEWVRVNEWKNESESEWVSEWVSGWVNEWKVKEEKKYIFIYYLIIKESNKNKRIIITKIIK